MSGVGVLRAGAVAVVELRRGPNNFVDIDMVAGIAEAYAALEAEPEVRAIVLAAEGKHFCAGADLGTRVSAERDSFAEAATRHLYKEAQRLIPPGKPVVAAVRGAAIGGGLGLALSADFRVGSPGTRMAVNFCRQGHHPGFGSSYTLPLVVGQQRAAWMFYTGRRVPGEEAHRMGLLDRLVPDGAVRASAIGMAGEIAVSGPLAVEATRRTLRAERAKAFREAVNAEAFAQNRLRRTQDFLEGVQAMNERRLPVFARG